MKKRIAVIDQWPDRPNAEKECLERIRRAAASLDTEVVVIDKLGRDLATSEEVTHDSIDFVISLHFETPKCFDAYSYVALWNPLAFYFWWGYRRTAGHLATHDDFLSCGSRWADDQIARLILGDASRREPVFSLNHSLSEPIIASRLRKDRRIFYCGINWERLGKGPGRHEEILKILDRHDALKIYGPDILDGIKVWDGFSNYVSPIPFDGISCIHEIANCGAALVFSSEAHRQSALMSNRLFEAAAAGAVVICDDNGFAREHFGDALLYVDTTRSQPEVAEQILEKLAWANANQEAAAGLAAKTQEIFLEKFCLKKQLAALLDGHEVRARALADAYQARQNRYPVRVIHFHDEHGSLENLRVLAEDIRRQIYPVSQIDIVVDEGTATASDVLSAVQEAGCETHVHEIQMTVGGRRTLAMGEVVMNLADGRPDDELVCITTGATRFFANHISSLVRKFEDDPSLRVAVSDILLRHFDPAGGEHRDFQPLRAVKQLRKSAPYRVSENCLVRFGGFAPVIGPCLRYLDEAVPYALVCGAGDAVAFTRRATTMRLLNHQGGACLPLEHQFLVVADSFPDHEEPEEPAADIFDQIERMETAKKRQLLIGLARSGMTPRVERFTRWIYRIVRRAA